MLWFCLRTLRPIQIVIFEARSWRIRSGALRLQRTGNRLDGGRNPRLENYAQWLEEGDMTQYIFVDYRVTRPVHSHPGTVIHSYSFANELTRLFTSQIFGNYITSFLTKGSKTMISCKEAISQSSVMVVWRRCKAWAQSDFPSILRLVSKVSMYN